MSLLDFFRSHLAPELAERLHAELADLKVRLAAAEAKLGIGASNEPPSQ
jgi:hypothetical protein